MVKKPDWLKIKLTPSTERSVVFEMIDRLGLHTVCASALCPNLAECFASKTAAFMILGDVCTRQCTFCNVRKGAPIDVDASEPERITKAVAELGLGHVVVTSVTRDDLPDCGAGQFARTIESMRRINVATIIEVLIPDFRGSEELLAIVVAAKPDIINHNVETVPRLYPEVRPGARYERSLGILRSVGILDSRIAVKSGIMLGLGESEQEVLDAMADLRDAGCEILTIGQYLAPSDSHHPVVEYVHPDAFERYRRKGLDMGFRFVASAPLVRSSYHAAESFKGFGGRSE
jgi:lipoic acid synthetase